MSPGFRFIFNNKSECEDSGYVRGIFFGSGRHGAAGLTEVRATKPGPSPPAPDSRSAPLNTSKRCRDESLKTKEPPDSCHEKSKSAENCSLVTHLGTQTGLPSAGVPLPELSVLLNAYRM